MVYVILQNSIPLMPCSNPIARLLLKQGKAKVSVSDIVKQLKQYSTYQMWNYYEECLSKQYWKHKILWSDGYFACSIGQVSQEIIEKYIQNQG